MAFYVDTSTFDQVYQLEVSDPALGGVGGVANRQAAQIANRTKYLRDKLQLEHSVSGEHDLSDLLAAFVEALTNAEFSNSAALAESKIAFELVGRTRPASRGTYTTTAQLAQDVYDVAVGAISTGAVTADYIASYLAANHNSVLAAHADIYAQYTRVASLNSQLLKDVLINKLYSDNIGSATYADGFVLDCSSASQVNNATSSNWSVDSVVGSFYPSPGATSQSATLSYTSSGTFTEEDARFPGGAVNFVVDTANTSGHFTNSGGTRVTVGTGQTCPKILKGCRLVIGGTSYGISGITGDGSANNAVSFVGTLAAGTYAVTGVYGTTIGANCTLNKVNDGSNVVPPLSTNYTVIGQVTGSPAPSSWLEITGFTSVYSIGGKHNVYAAFTTDGVEYKVFFGGAWHTAARNSGGVWQYYNGSSFVNADDNSVAAAISQACTISNNQVAITAYSALTATDWQGLGVGATNKLAICLSTTDTTGYTVPTITSASYLVTLKIPGMTLITLTPGTLALSTNPLKARVALEIKPVGSMNVNTDITVFVSKDGGATYTSMSLDDVVTTSTNTFMCSWVANSLPATDTRNMVVKLVSPQGVDFDCTLLACFTS